MARGPYLQHAEDGILVVWDTDAPGEGRVRFFTEAGESGEAAAPAGTRRREATLRGLEPGTSYTYRVYSPAGPLSTPGGEVEFQLRTPDPHDLRLVVFGDCGTASAAQRAVADAIRNESLLPDLVMIVGDVIYPPFNDQSYDTRFFAPFAALLPSVPFYALLGNHDYEHQAGRPFLEVFSLPRNGPPGLVPETSYALERASAQLVVHDTNVAPSALLQHAVPWHRQLARASAHFRLVFQHHALYSSGPNSSVSPTPELRALLAPVYAATGVDVVFNGHDHFYERTRPIDGVVYVTSGAGGADLYPRVAANPWTAALVNDRHGYSYVEVGERTLKLRQMDVAGLRLDAMTLTKAVAFDDSLRVAEAPGDPPRGWTAADFDDSGWGRSSHAAGRVRARSAFAGPREPPDDAFLRVRGVSEYEVWLNGEPVARRSAGPTAAAGAAHAVALDPKRLRRGRNVIALEGFREAGEAPREGVELVLVSR
jgi:hypothetical protein